MKIRTKLNGLIFGMILGFVASIFLLVFNIFQLGVIDREQLLMDNLLFSYTNVYKMSSKVYISSIDVIRPQFEESIQELNLAIEDLESVRLLPAIDRRIAESFQIIHNLNELQAQRFTRAFSVLDEMRQGFNELTGYDFSFVISDLPLNVFVTRSEGFEEIMSLREQVFTSIHSLGVDASISQIIEQKEMIQRAVAERRQRTFLFSIALAIVIIFLSIVVGFSVIRGIQRPLRNIREDVGILSSGDLRRTIHLSGRDEITDLARDLNAFIDVLKGSVQAISGLSTENRGIKEELMVSTEESSRIVEEIHSEMEAVLEQSTRLFSSIETSIAAIGDIKSVIGGENEQIQEQMAMVEQSTASVTEMIASIQNVAKNTIRNKDSAETLVQTAQFGGERLRETNENIGEINASIEDIRNMASLIQSIAAQTNLLAMNAAIEAAHAGDAGRGFAVVANEIRKLAEASSNSSKEIGASLKGIVEHITAANDSSNKTTEAFGEINSQIMDVKNSFTQISESMRELEVGGSQILEAMETLSQVSVVVKEGSSRMSDSSDKVAHTVDDVKTVITATRSSIDAINESSKGITEKIQLMIDLASQMQTVSYAMDDAISYFTLVDDASMEELSGEEELEADDVLMPDTAEH